MSCTDASWFFDYVQPHSFAEPQASAYAESKQAEEAGDTERVEEIAVELRTGTYVQSSLFDFANITQ